MDLLLLALASALVAMAVAEVLRRRRGAPLEPLANWHVPVSLRRADFARPEAPWLVVAFTSATCDTCAAAWERVRALESADVAVQEVEAKAMRDLHQRYRIDAVPLVVVADRGGGVHAHFVGPFTASDLWGALAGLRLGGSRPVPGDGP